MRMRCDGAGRSISAISARGIESGSFRYPNRARREERQPVQRRPIDQFQPPIVMFDERGATFYPIAIVEIQHALHLAHFGVVDMAAYHSVEATAPSFQGQ